MVLKEFFLCSMLIVLAVAEIYEFDNNIIEYDSQPAQGFALPYPYQDYRDKRVVIESSPVYSDSHGNIILPATEVESAGLITTAISYVFGAVKSVFAFLFTNVAALLAGSVIALGVCNLTSFCDTQITIYEAQTELRSLATPERLSRAAKFVKEAIQKYSELQK